MTLLIDFSVIVVLILGIRSFRDPRGARLGNLTAAFALLCAFVLVLYRQGVVDAATVSIALVAGGIIGYGVARAVTMIQIPAMVAFQHGAGGVAAFLVSAVELTRDARVLDPVSEISGVLGLTIGALTFSGSMVASAKLANKMRQAPQVLPAHDTLLLLNIGFLLLVGTLSLLVPPGLAGALYPAQIVLAACFGILFSIRIGGADMPVLISFLNATAGLAAALCGMVIGNQLLIAFGATVAASGSILTHVMCKAMNRGVLRVFLPHLKSPSAVAKKAPSRPAPLAHPRSTSAPKATPKQDPLSKAAEALNRAKKVVIIPGYGMALAKAQFKVVELAAQLAAKGADVKYAIHPVAGRMPGHMNVILAEAEVDYDDLLEMDQANPLLQETDVALVVGACDVVNPAAMEQEGTPISGMPILTAHEAQSVIVCNLDQKPGYSGVENPLYQNSKTILLLGDAQSSVSTLLAALQLTGA
jgi:NAD(P) transhydrogenase subunit beta